jgi:hypothetical protein
MNLYPIITTLVPAECRDFYQQALDARVLFETDWYVHLQVGKYEIGFLKPNPPQKLPVFQHTRPSAGLTLAIEVPDVKACYLQMTRRKIQPLGKPEKFPNGEWAFSVMDPAGVVLNFVEHHGSTSEPIVEL